ncbi:MAG TPA: 6,7-dimethyl-8-ribityllumazine synthase, partial [Caulobacterales bacterium]|nr:6,7-dimethyl-8-ribityllumazine synthase [Caulobacterales bacterium]
MAAASGSPHAPPRLEGARVMIVAAAYYEAIEKIVAATIAGAERVLRAAGVESVRVDVPGALEIPGAIAAAHAASSHGRLPALDGFVALG